MTFFSTTKTACDPQTYLGNVERGLAVRRSKDDPDGYVCFQATRSGDSAWYRQGKRIDNPFRECTICGSAIGAERYYAALSRGRLPLYDSQRCKTTATRRRQRQRAKQSV